MTARTFIADTLVVWLAGCLLIACMTEVRVSYQRRGGIRFLRVGRTSISFCRSKRKG